MLAWQRKDALFMVARKQRERQGTRERERERGTEVQIESLES